MNFKLHIQSRDLFALDVQALFIHSLPPKTIPSANINKNSIPKMYIITNK